MRSDADKIYSFAPLDSYSVSQRLSIRAADLGFYSAIKAIGSTVRFKAEGMEHYNAIIAAGHRPIIAFWHDRIFLGTYFWRDRGIVVMTSQSFDGEYIARFIQRFGYGAIRGSSTRGGPRALIEMVKTMRRGIAMSMTLDGPRGPRYEAKMGAVMLAKRSGNPLMPFSVEARSFRTVRSWDRLQIPMPFTRALIQVGAPIYVPADADEDVLKHKLAELQTAMDALVERGRSWRELGK